MWNLPLVNRPSKQRACCPSKAFVMETSAVILPRAFLGWAIIVLPGPDALPRRGQKFPLSVLYSVREWPTPHPGSILSEATDAHSS